MSIISKSSSVWLRSICRKNGVLLSQEQIDLLGKFVSLLLHINRQVNLISRKDEHNIWENHILHSISPVFRFSFNRIETMLDLGTGGGLPGVPLKILLPYINFTLVDSIHKKTQVVEKLVHELKLSNVTVVCSRVEEFGKKPGFSNKFDAVICRAVAPLKKLVKWSSPIVKKTSNQSLSHGSSKMKIEVPRGSLLAFKGGDLEKEIEETKRVMKLKSLHEIPLVFHGSETLSLVDKKIILVQF